MSHTLSQGWCSCLFVCLFVCAFVRLFGCSFVCSHINCPHFRTWLGYSTCFTHLNDCVHCTNHCALLGIYAQSGLLWSTHCIPLNIGVFVFRSCHFPICYHVLSHFDGTDDQNRWSTMEVLMVLPCPITFTCDVQALGAIHLFHSGDCSGGAALRLCAVPSRGFAMAPGSIHGSGEEFYRCHLSRDTQLYTISINIRPSMYVTCSFPFFFSPQYCLLLYTWVPFPD